MTQISEKVETSEKKMKIVIFLQNFMNLKFISLIMINYDLMKSVNEVFNPLLYIVIVNWIYRMANIGNFGDLNNVK